MNKKAFTLVELLAIIVILGILMTIVTVGYSKYLVSSRKKSFEIAEKNFISSVEGAYADCLSNSTNVFCSNHQSFGYQNETVYLKELVDNEYSKKIKNPYDLDTYCDEDLSYVKVVGSGDGGNNKTVTYQVCLVCGDVKSTSCSD